MKEKKQKVNDAYSLMQEDKAKKFSDNLVLLLTCKKPELESANNVQQTEITNQKTKENTDDVCQIFMTNFERLGLLNSFKNGDEKLTPEEFKEKKREKYQIIDKAKIESLAEDLKVNYNIEFDMLTDAIFYIFFIIIYIVMIYLQLEVPQGADVNVYMNSIFKQKISSDRLDNFDQAQNFNEKLMQAFFDKTSNTCDSPINQSSNKLNTTALLQNYLFLNPPYFRVTYRLYDNIINTGYDSAFFADKIITYDSLDEINCPSLSDFTELIKFQSTQQSGPINYIQPGSVEAYSRCGGII